MPTGARGFMMSVMLAAIMGSLTSVFNSSSTLFTMDIWPMIRRKKKPSEMELVIVGRAFVTLLAVLSVLWLPVIKMSQGSQLFNYTQSIISYLGPPICVVYVLAIFSKRINEKGAFWGLMLGLVLGLTRFALDIIYSPRPCGSNLEGGLFVKDIPDIVSKVHFLHFGCILFLVVLFVTVAVSLATEPIDEKHLYRLTFWSRHSEKERINLDAEVLKQEATSTIERDSIVLPGGLTLEDGNRKSLKRRDRIINILCCLTQSQRNSDRVEMRKPTPEEDVKESLKRLAENQTAKRFLDVNGLILLGVSIAIWVVYR